MRVMEETALRRFRVNTATYPAIHFIVLSHVCSLSQHITSATNETSAH